MNIQELKEENEKLKQELEEAKDSKLIKRLIKNLEDIKKGKFLTRKRLGL